MVRVVPSQARDLIKQLFPDLHSEQPDPGAIGTYQATAVRALLDVLDQMPEELIRLPAAYTALYLANVSALACAWEDRVQSGNAVRVSPLARASYRPIREIDGLLSRCPDEAPVPATVGLEFVQDAALREALRIDMSAADSALMNHEYKASTVLAGSVLEALLMWALETYGDANVRAKVLSASPKALNEWTLGAMIDAACHCGLISSDTKKQAELAQNFRNLIHPGRQARLQDQCDRGTALSALAAVERAATDLTKKYPPKI